MQHRSRRLPLAITSALAALFAASPAAAQTTLLVASDEPTASADLDCGTPVKPCIDIQLAVNQATDDTTINVRPNARGYQGFYAHPMLRVDARNVTIRSEPGTIATINALVAPRYLPTALVVPGALAVLAGVQGWTVQNLRFRVTGRDDIFAIAIVQRELPTVRRANGVRVEGCAIEVTCVAPDRCAAGIGIDGADNVTLLGNNILGAGGAIYGSAASNVSVVGNLIYSSTGIGIYFGGGDENGAWLNGDLRNVRVERNLVSRVQRITNTTSDASSSSFGNGLWLNDVTGGLVENNGLVDVAGIGLLLGSSPNPTTDIAVRHNTIVADLLGVGADILVAPVYVTNVSGIAFRNNILHPTSRGRVYVIGAADIARNSFDYVGYSHAGTPDDMDFATVLSDKSSEAWSLNRWRMAGFDEHHWNQPARQMLDFGGMSNRRYHLIPGSVAIDRGTTDLSTPPDRDFEGTARLLGAAPDLGYDEFTPLASGDGGVADGGALDGGPIDPDELVVHGGTCTASPGAARGPRAVSALLGAALASGALRRRGRRRAAIARG